MKAFAILIVLAVTAVVLFSAVDTGRQSIVLHRDRMSMAEGL